MQMTHKSSWIGACAAAVVGLGLALPAQAEPFTQADVEKYMAAYMEYVQRGDELTHGGIDGNGVSCDECHPNATNMHPETYPKFQKQLGKVSQLYEMINWCIQVPMEGQGFEADSEDMIAILAYANWERRGVPMAPGKR